MNGFARERSDTFPAGVCRVFRFAIGLRLVGLQRFHKPFFVKFQRSKSRNREVHPPPGRLRRKRNELMSLSNDVPHQQVIFRIATGKLQKDPSIIIRSSGHCKRRKETGLTSDIKLNQVYELK